MAKPPKKPIDPLDSKDSGLDSILDSIQGELNKAFGEGTASRLSDAATYSKIDNWVSSRSIVVDSVLRGGRPVGSSLVPFGRQVELSGKPGSGKTTLCAQIAAETVAQGGIVLITDTEERIDHDYWTSLGADPTKMVHIQATTLEEVFEKQYRAIKFARETAPNHLMLSIWDSLGGTSLDKIVDDAAEGSPMEQAEKAMGKKAKVISSGMELINTLVSSSNCCYLYTNHIYQKMGNTGYGEMTETPGGNKPKFFATVRLRLTPVGKIQAEDPVSGEEMTIGHRVRVKALKNSMAGHLLERDAVILGGSGYSNDYTIFEVAGKLGAIKKSGAWSTWETPSGDEVKFQGWNGFLDKVIPHPEYQDLFDTIVNAM